MTAPILIPAFACVLRPGLSIVHNGYNDPSVRICMHVDDQGRVAYAITDEQGDVQEWGRSKNVSLNLRNPAVRDAVVRAIWRKLRPDDSEPTTAPAWSHVEAGEGFPCWWWVSTNHVDDDSDEDVETFGADNPTHAGGIIDHSVPSLASVPLDSPDRDLLALAEVAKAVLS